MRCGARDFAHVIRHHDSTTTTCEVDETGVTAVVLLADDLAAADSCGQQLAERFPHAAVATGLERRRREVCSGQTPLSILGEQQGCFVCA